MSHLSFTRVITAHGLLGECKMHEKAVIDRQFICLMDRGWDPESREDDGVTFMEVISAVDQLHWSR